MKTLRYLVLVGSLTLSQLSMGQNVDDFGSPVLGKGQTPQQLDRTDEAARTSQTANWAMVLAGGAAFFFGINKIAQRDCKDTADASGATVHDCSYPGTNSGIDVALLGAGAASWGLWRMNINSLIDDSKPASGQSGIRPSEKSNLFFASTGQQHSVLFEKSF